MCSFAHHNSCFDTCNKYYYYYYTNNANLFSLCVKSSNHPFIHPLLYFIMTVMGKKMLIHSNEIIHILFCKKVLLSLNFLGVNLKVPWGNFIDVDVLITEKNIFLNMKLREHTWSYM